MPTLELDHVKEADVELVRGRFRARRTGIIRNMDTTVDPGQILAQALAVPGMPPVYDPYPHPSYNYALLLRHVIQPITNNKARVTLMYEDPGLTSGGGTADFVLQRRTQLVWVESQLHPKDKKVMRLGWKDPVTEVRRDPDVATVRYLKPMQTLTASGWLSDEPPAAMITALGKVNTNAWHGLAKGYWLYSGQEDRSEDRGNSYTVTLEFLTNYTEDWSTYVVFRDRQTGRSLPVKDTDTAALKALPYAYEVNNSKNGILKVGMYDLADFGTIFGF